MLPFFVLYGLSVFAVAKINLPVFAHAKSGAFRQTNLIRRLSCCENRAAGFASQKRRFSPNNLCFWNNLMRKEPFCHGNTPFLMEYLILSRESLIPDGIFNIPDEFGCVLRFYECKIDTFRRFIIVFGIS